MTSKNATTQDNGSLVETPRTDAIALSVHASFFDWPDEARDFAERYDLLCETLERETLRLSGRVQELERALEQISGYDRLAVGPALDIARAALAGGDKG